MSNLPLHIVWFKRDLRIDDHQPLANAAARGPVLPLFVVEPEGWRQPDISARHWAFVRESLNELREDLARLGQPLVVRVGNITDILEAIRSTRDIDALWSHQETGNTWTYERDLKVAAWCRDHGIPWHQQRQHGVMRGLKSREGWAKRWDRFMAEATTPPPPSLPPLSTLEPGPIPTATEIELTNDACAGRQQGGRASAVEQLTSLCDP